MITDQKKVLKLKFNHDYIDVYYKKKVTNSERRKDGNMICL